jgi:hypothetical protein
VAFEDLDNEGIWVEQHEFVEQLFAENKPTDEVPSSTEETDDRSLDETSCVS